jgi:hypothetical protein
MKMYGVYFTCTTTETHTVLSYCPSDDESADLLPSDAGKRIAHFPSPEAREAAFGAAFPNASEGPCSNVEWSVSCDQLERIGFPVDTIKAG